VDRGDVLEGSPTSPPGPFPARLWRIAAGINACILGLICAYRWAIPGDARPHGVTDPFMGALLISLAWQECLRWGRLNAGFRKRQAIIVTWRVFLPSVLSLLLAYLLVALVEEVPPAVGAAAGVWPGGWALGAAGLIVGALVGAGLGWLLRLLAGPVVEAWYVQSPGPTVDGGPGRDTPESRAAADAGREPGSP